MKKSRIIAPAAAILVFSSAAAVTGTVAWFTASNLVSVSGMYMKAAVENGIVITNEDNPAGSKVAADWGTSTVATYSGEGKEFYPTSTKGVDDPSSSTAFNDTWYHGSSQKADDGQYEVNYDQLTIKDYFAAGDPESTDAEDGTQDDGIFGYRATEDRSFRNVYLLNKFYVQASATADLGEDNRDIYIKNLKVVVKGGDAASEQLLNNSLRILVTYKMYGDSSATFSNIIAPIDGATGKYFVHKSFSDFSTTKTYAVGAYVNYSDKKYECTTAVTEAGAWDSTKWKELGDSDFDVDAVTYGEMQTAETTGDKTGINLVENITIPGYTNEGTKAIEFSFYMYFEGEDTNHKSNNLTATLDELAISFDLGNKVHVNP